VRPWRHLARSHGRGGGLRSCALAGAGGRSYSTWSARQRSLTACYARWRMTTRRIGQDVSTWAIRDDERRGDAGARCLRIVSDKEGMTAPLPAQGAIVVGRGAGANVSIDDPRVSRRHARIHLDATVSVEDLGSENGTIVRGVRLPAGERIEIALGEAVHL